MHYASIIKRIDSLGRIVLPKDIRQKLELRENDEVEIILNTDASINIKKYSKLKDNIKIKYKKYIEVLSSILIDRNFLVTDNTEIIYVNNTKDKYLESKKISKKTFEYMLDRKAISIKKTPTFNILEENIRNKETRKAEIIYMNILVPIIINSNVEGSIIMYTKELNLNILEKEIELLKYSAKLIESSGLT